MDAIPSLCASSASVSIAVVGYALAQSRPSTRSEQSLRISNARSISSQETPSVTLSAPAYLAPIPRTRPSTSPHPPHLHKRASALSGLQEEGESHSFVIKGNTSRPQTGRPSGDLQKRESWYRRFSNIPPSIDGSVGALSFGQPSTPSVFSNGSSAAPLFGQPSITVHTRNKLVKRSTSYKRFHNDDPIESTFASTGRGSTFRRPATSHQRSETLRLRNAQQGFGNFKGSPDLTSESWSRKRNREQAADNSTTSSGLLRPFFTYQRSRIPRDSRTSGARIFGGADHITSVVANTGEHAVLVPGNCVERPKMDSIRSIDPLVEESTQTDPRDDQSQDQSLPMKRTRHSFSTASEPAASVPWRMNRISSLRRTKNQDNRGPERRIVSAPQQIKSKVRTESNRDKPISALPPSPLPRLETLSVFEIDMNGPTMTEQDSSGLDDSFGNSDLDSPVGAAFLSHRTQHPLRLRSTSRRASRVPSDRSTVFGSDNENSRVFSVDGDDADRRSETVYDSVRTDASGSSHSGARNYRAENVFGNHSAADYGKQDLTTLQEKLTSISINNEHDLIAEEEESIRTPIWRQASEEDNMATPSAHRLNAGKQSISIAESTKVNYDNDADMSDDDLLWDEELGIDISERASRTLEPVNVLNIDIGSPATDDNTERPRSNIFDWSEQQSLDRTSSIEPATRPHTSHPQQGPDRGGRPPGRRPTNGFHVRSQSVPLPPDNGKHKFNNAKKLDNWMLGNKGVSEDWDNDFDFEEEEVPAVPELVADANNAARPLSSGIVVPREILERQATVHGQFGQVKELTLLVEQLRRLRHSATVHGILDGQSSELWKEAIGIIDLATLDEEEPEALRPPSPNSTSFEFDHFDEDIASQNRRSSTARSARETTPSAQIASPAGSKQGTPKSRPRHDSVARVKNVLANIHQQRDPLDPPLELEEEASSPSKNKKMPFDTTSLRDLVTRAGVVTRACKEIIRKIEDPDYVPNTPERRPTTPPDPPFFSQIFSQSPAPSTPASDRRTSRAVERVTFSTPTTTNNDHDAHGSNVSVMTVSQP